jgi:hypothetical protein
MCIDYTSLNKACLKDPFPLPRIDQIMDSTSGCDLLCFLDAYSSFHQISMSREDEEHTAFITVDSLFCYVSMPYSLKNAFPTFVCAMHKTFSHLIIDLIEVYVNDIIVKIKSHASRLQAHPLHRKALASPRDRGTKTTARQGSGITTCLVAPDPPPGAGGFRSRHVMSGSWPLACPCISKMPDIRLIMASPGTRCRQRIKCVCDRSYAAYGRH